MRRVLLPSALILVAATIGCADTTSQSNDAPDGVSPSTLHTAGVPTASAATAAPTPTSAVATQAEIFGAAVSWLDEQVGVALPNVVYVNQEVTAEISDFGGPEIAAAGPPLFGNSLSSESGQAIADVLGGAHDVRFVGSAEDALDTSGRPSSGGSVFDDGELISLSAPRSFMEEGAEHFLLAANMGSGCEGGIWLLDISQADHGFAVTGVLNRAAYIC